MRPLRAGENEVIAGGVDSPFCLLRVHNLKSRFDRRLWVVSSALHSGSAICRLSLAGGLLQGKACRRCGLRTAIVGLAQPLTEAHGNNDDRDSMQRRFPHDGFLSCRRLHECCYAVCVSGTERCREWMYSPPLRSDCAILRPLSPACAD
jgi:hypothetical protein